MSKHAFNYGGRPSLSYLSGAQCLAHICFQYYNRCHGWTYSWRHGRPKVLHIIKFGAFNLICSLLELYACLLHLSLALKTTNAVERPRSGIRTHTDGALRSSAPLPLLPSLRFALLPTYIYLSYALL
jgi:hypothetical protein